MAELEAKDGVTRYVWIDMFAASQNLLAGVFKDAAITKEADPAGYKASGQAWMMTQWGSCNTTKRT